MNISNNIQLLLIIIKIIHHTSLFFWEEEESEAISVLTIRLIYAAASIPAAA